jgi:hypothetical protein
MPNNNQELLEPKFWASSFVENDAGKYNLQNQVNRDVTMELGQIGMQLDIPMTPDVPIASNWDGKSVLPSIDVTQGVRGLVLERSPSTRFILDSRDMSRKPYDLIKEYGIPFADSIMRSVNQYIYNKMLEATNFTDARVTFTEDTLTDARTRLNNRLVSELDRYAVASPDDTGILLKRDAFKLVNQSGTMDGQNEGTISRKSGFDISENNIIANYTPSDLTGTTNAALAIGNTSVAVAGFTDSVTKLKAGDIFTIAGETGSPLHTITSVTPLVGATTVINFAPAMVSAVVLGANITVTPTRSIVCFTKNAVAFAARSYGTLPDGVGTKQTTMMLNGLPIRISIRGTDSIGCSVQFDCLIGAVILRNERIERILRA